MAKPTGFLDIKRKTAPYRPIKQRKKDYKDVSRYLSFEEIQQQAARCMDCGIPFCHCTGCPVENLIPEWNDLVYRGNWKQALLRLEKTNSLPEITGRVCPATCEASCTLSVNDSPVTIKQIELAIIEYGFKKGWVTPCKPGKESGRKVAVIGSGPAGLAAAQTLRSMGHSVTVFEKSDKLGGILRYGIPDFKLEKWIIDRRLDLMKKSGIKFRTCVNTGEDISAAYLLKSFDSILLAIGAGQPRNLNVPGRELKGTYFAMDYLTHSNRSVAKQQPVPPRRWNISRSTYAVERGYSAKGKNVLVIGGGDTGSDCVGTANRQGAKKVYQFEILPKPDDWDQEWNPSWPDWPTILRTTSSHEEGVKRDWSILTKKITGKNGSVQEVHCSRVEWKKSENSPKLQMIEVPDSDFTLKVDMILLAMGFVHVEHSKLLSDLGIRYDQHGNIDTDQNYIAGAAALRVRPSMTAELAANKNAKGRREVGGKGKGTARLKGTTDFKVIFAAGDSSTGASLVVRAIYHGQQAAKAIHRLLLKICKNL